MYVCICEGLTDKQLKRAINEGDIRNCQQLKACLGAGSQCGKCNTELKSLLKCTKKHGQATVQ